MKKFEIGKRYKEGGVTFEVLSRTAKTVKLALIQHEGRANEKLTSVKSKKIYNWNTEEVVYFGCYEIHA